MKNKHLLFVASSVAIFGLAGALHFGGTFRTVAPSSNHEISPFSSSSTAETENNELSAVPHLPQLLLAPAHLPPLATSDTSTRYRIVALPKKFSANALNDKTEIAGTWDAGEKTMDGYTNTYSQAAIWKNNTITCYPKSDEQPKCYANAISETSEVGCVGGATYIEPIHGRYDTFIWSFAYPASVKLHAARYQTQTAGHLSNLSGVTVAGINRHRQMVGWCYPWDDGEYMEFTQDYAFWDVAGEDLGSQSGFYWDGQQFLELGAGSAAYGINERNQVVGAQNGKIALWQGNERKFLGEGRAYSINNRGWVVGEKTMPGKNIMFYNVAPIRHGFVWRGSSTLEDLKCLPGDTNSKARWINDRGQIVGLSLRVLGETKTQTRAVLWQAGKMIDLNTLLPRGSGWVLTDARTINHKGQIIGQGLLNGNERSFLLTPR